MEDSDIILQNLFHLYITTISTTDPYNVISSYKDGISVCGVLYNTSQKVIIDMCKIIKEIASSCVSFESYVNILEKIMILAHRSRSYTLANSNQYKLLTFLKIFGSFLRSNNLIELICLADSFELYQSKHRVFYDDIKNIKKMYNI